MDKRQAEDEQVDERKSPCVDWVSAYGFDADKLDFTLDGALPHYVFKVRTNISKECIRITVFRTIVDGHTRVFEDGFAPEELMAHSSMKIVHRSSEKSANDRVHIQPAVVKLEHSVDIHPERGLVLGELLQVVCRETKKAHLTLWNAMMSATVNKY